MSILILGKGYIGTHFANYLNTQKASYIHVSKSDVDYSDQVSFRDFLQQKVLSDNIKAVVNCSGYTGAPNVDACEDNKQTCYNYNVVYPLRVAAVCNEVGVPLYHVGSGCIFTGYEKEFTENDDPNFGIFSDDSSYYSKCKHIFETAVHDNNTRILRIRIPFTSTVSSKNYFIKLLKYKDLISERNSITSVTDFCLFLKKFIHLIPDPGIYNVVNPDPVTAREVVHILQENGIDNKKWKFIDVADLKTRAKRSNCVLSTSKIKALGLQLPSSYDSLKRDIEIMSQEYAYA